MGKHIRPTLSALLGALFFLCGLNASAMEQQQQCQQAPIAQKTKKNCESSESSSDSSSNSSSDSSSDSSHDSSSSSESIDGDCNHKTFGKLVLSAGRAFTMSAGAFLEWGMGAHGIAHENKHLRKMCAKRQRFIQKIQTKKQRHYGEMAYCNFEGKSFGPDDEVFNQKNRVKFHRAYLPNTQFHDRDLSNVSFRRAYVGFDATFSNITFSKRTFRGVRYIDQAHRGHRINKFQAKRLYNQYQGRIDGQQTMQHIIEQMQQAPMTLEEPQVVVETTSGDGV